MTKKLVFVVLALFTLFTVSPLVRGALIAYYPLDGNANDMSGFGDPANGTLVGSPTFEAGPTGFSQALKLNGTSQYVDCGNPGGKFDVTSQVSVACWAKLSAWTSTGSDTLIAKGPQGAAFRLYRFGTGNPLIFALGGLTPNYYAYVSTGKNINDGQWHHIAGVYNGTTIYLYIDGVVDDTSDATGSIVTNALNVWIGNNPGNTTRFWNGWIDDVYIFNNGLNATEVGQVMEGAYARPYSSRSPKPSDAATDVSRDTVLSWAAGKDAVAHDVYFGTSSADVQSATKTDPKGVLVALGLTDTTFDPAVGHLELGQTYYWRVDEANNSGGNPTTGDVWSFTTEPVAYAMTSKITATASSQKSANEGPENTINGSGIANDLADVNGKAMWTTLSTKSGGTFPAWIQYNFDKVYKLHEMWVWNYNGSSELEMGFGAKSTKIEYLSADDQWTTLGDFELAQGIAEDGYAHNTTVPFQGVAAKSVRITIDETWDSVTQTGLSEVRFFYIPVWAKEPQPAIDSTNVDPTSLTLSWRSGREAASHDVYVGTDANALPKLGTAVTNSFAPADLGLGVKYYWRVDEVNQATNPTTWTGAVWSFATPNFLAIDDMESYNDKDPAIFNTWKDGYEIPTNGALVGNDSAPYAETATIHGGKQAMPFRYGQKTAANVSEATRTFAQAQNWTLAKADTLRLWVRGRPGDLPAGSLPAATSTFDISGGGSDIYQGTDEFRYVYRQLNGDGSITAKIDFQQPTNQYAKAGVMIRAGLEVGALQAYMTTLPGTPNTTGTPTQVEWSFRMPASDATARSVSTTPSPTATWVRITRKGDVITGEYSVDGVTWTGANLTTTPQTIAMGNPVNIGLVVCSHVAGTLGEAKFSNVKTTGNVTGDWLKADIGYTVDGTYAVNTPDTFYVTLTDSGNHTKTVIPTVASPVCTTGVWQAVDIPFTQFAGVSMNSITSMVIGVGDKAGANPPRGAGRLLIDDIGFGCPAK